MTNQEALTRVGLIFSGSVCHDHRAEVEKSLELAINTAKKHAPFKNSD